MTTYLPRRLDSFVVAPCRLGSSKSGAMSASSSTAAASVFWAFSAGATGFALLPQAVNNVIASESKVRVKTDFLIYEEKFKLLFYLL
jgi:hypothetical protein